MPRDKNADALRRKAERSTDPRERADEVRVLPMTAAELVRRAVRHIAHSRGNRDKGVPLWGLVGDAFSCGSTYATEICRFADVDPHSTERLPI